MTAITSPYRVAGESPLFDLERRIETELTSTRELMTAYANDEVRVARLGLVGKATHEELRSVRAALAAVVSAEARLVRELLNVRAEIIMRGDRRAIDPRPPLNADIRFAVGRAVLFVFALLLIVRFCVYLVVSDTAHQPPPGTAFAWYGTPPKGESWLYVAAPDGTTVDIDGRRFRPPSVVAISALRGHDLRFEGGPAVSLRWIPCTTAVVSYDPGQREASVERFFNHATCF